VQQVWTNDSCSLKYIAAEGATNYNALGGLIIEHAAVIADSIQDLDSRLRFQRHGV
jgi:hypothetical protein